MNYQGMHVYVALEPFQPLYGSDVELNKTLEEKNLWTRLVIVDPPGGDRCVHLNSWANLEELLRAQLHPFDGTSLFYIGETTSGPLTILPSPGPYLDAMVLPQAFVTEIRNRRGNLSVNLPSRQS